MKIKGAQVFTEHPFRVKCKNLGKDGSSSIFVSASIGEDYEQHGDAVDAISLWFTAEKLPPMRSENVYGVRGDNILTLV